MFKKPLLLNKAFAPLAAENRMSVVDDVAASRKGYLENEPNNLKFLLEKRYQWMNDFIKLNDVGVEVGCGNGLSEFFIRCDNYLRTDYADFEWIDKKVDALNMPFADGSLDFLVSSNMIHHLAKPYIFFQECHRVLKPGGLMLVQEINASFFLRLALKLMKHEGYNYDVDPFDKDSVCNDPENPWSGNNALPNLLFDDMKKFEANFPFKCVREKHTEFSIFLLSGGVTAKTKTVQLGRALLSAFDALDHALIGLSKNTFALQRQIVLKKV